MGNCFQIQVNTETKNRVTETLAMKPNENNAMLDKQQGSNEVYYYVQGFGGRGTIVRLAFEIAGVKYIDASDEESGKNVGADIETGYPTFAYPVVKIDGAIISQTPAICQYVMAKGGFQPKCTIQQTQSLQVALTAADAFDELWLFHYKHNKIPTDDWIKTRIYKFFKTLQAQLKQNKEGKGFYFDDKPSIADIFVYDLLNRFRAVQPELYEECEFQLLKDFANRFEQYPAVKKFLSSDTYRATSNAKADTGRMKFLLP